MLVRNAKGAQIIISVNDGIIKESGIVSGRTKSNVLNNGDSIGPTQIPDLKATLQSIVIDVINISNENAMETKTRKTSLRAKK